MTADTQKVFLITPRLGGLANDLMIQTEEKKTLYHVRTRLFSPLGQQYLIYDDKEQLILTTREDHTVMFPTHTVFEKDNQVAKLGQQGVIPQNYFIEIDHKPRLIMRIPIFSGIFNLEGHHGIMAEIAQHRTTWIVAIKTEPDYLLCLMLIAVIYKEYSIGG